ncbi:PLP-dependent aminotransferase family protein [Sciscionella sediminilitoris]|uniref:aminotransferase-like domain-containing protein n=1 Tax=Sciscionella sediminilitoris TaxID=1445613 RepID=UPI0004DF29F3|nr:PLP-dependent aminotransferase family protein [Sciscionella sp. SE31]
MPTVTAAWLAAHISNASARGIAAAVADLVRQGDIEPGAKLAPVRAVATELDVSPTTVAEAWAILRRHQVLRTQGRNGTVVTGPPSVPHPVRYERIGHFAGQLRTDLSLAAPDPALLPELGAALEGALGDPRFNAYQRELVTPALDRAARAHWPFEPQALMAVGGGYEGILLACQTQVIAGDRVVVEEPTAARLLDVLDLVGAEVLPVGCDESGPLPDELAEAMRRKPAAFLYQPRSLSACGHVVTAARRAELAEILEPGGTAIIEDDGLGPLAAAPPHSLGALLPERTVLISSYSKSHGPDLRMGLAGGSSELIDKMRVLRSFGTGWTSRILQGALAALLEDPADARRLTEARERYAERSAALLRALAERNVPAQGAEGFVVWMRVHEETDALVTLAAHGIAASPGSRYYSGSPQQPCIRIGCARLDPESAEFTELADLLALAARGAGSG